MVQVTGIEPARRGHQILNLARLPVPPHLRGYYVTTKYLICQLYYSDILLTLVLFNGRITYIKR